MATSKITLTGFESFLKYNDKSLFDGLILPDGIDKDVLINNIMFRGGEFECLYGSPEYMRTMISMWGSKWYRTFTKWIKALNIEYDPLYNYDRHEEWSDRGTETRKDTGTNKESINDNESVSSEVENTVSAFDSSSYSPHDKSEGDTSSKSSRTVDASSGLDSAGNTESSHVGHLYGNIGVTTSQQMLESELNIAAWNVYEHITDLFLSEFCILIYE